MRTLAPSEISSRPRSIEYADMSPASSLRSVEISAFIIKADSRAGSCLRIIVTVVIAPLRLPAATCCLACASAESRSSGSSDTALA